MGYRKLTNAELTKLLTSYGVNFKDGRLTELRTYVKKYYPASAALVRLQYDSEYNDEGYDVSVQYLGVYDRNGDELLPLKDTANEARKLWSTFEPEPSNSGYGNEEPREEEVIALGELPELYVKE